MKFVTRELLVRTARRRSMRALILVVAAVVIGACGDQGKEIRLNDAVGSPNEADWRPAQLGQGSWQGARTSVDGRKVKIILVGGPEFEARLPCTVAYSARVEETSADVRVELLSASPPADDEVACTAEGHFRSVEIDLAEPLGDRRLVEVQFERTRPVFEGSKLSEPAWLPSGWALLNEGPGYPDPESMSSWRRTWSGPQRPPKDNHCTPGDSAVMLTEGSADVTESYPSNGEQPVRSHDVAGNSASYFEGGSAGVTRLSWVDADQGFVLASMPGCVGDTPASEEILLRIARSLTTPS